MQELLAWVPGVKEIAREAGRILHDIYHGGQFERQLKEDATPVTSADLAADAYLKQALSALTPHVPVLTEEAADIPFSQRSNWRQYWLVDPLDGTGEFIAGSGDFGHPGRWRPLRLIGGPALAERFVEALGPSWTLAGGTVSALLLILATLAVGERRHRRRIAALLERLAGLDAPPAAAPALAPGEPRVPPVAAAPPEPPSPPPEIVPAPSQPSAHAAPAGAGHQVPPALDWLEHAAEHPPAGAGERFALRALRAIRARLDAPLAPADLADTLCMSLRTLERHLTEELGCSPSELILAEKMRAARHLLVAGGLQVQEVARRVGYDDPAHFSRRFKAYFGAAPKAFAAARERAA